MEKGKNICQILLLSVLFKIVTSQVLYDKSNSGISTFPNDIPSNVEVINLNSNTISGVPDGSLQFLTLQSVDISDNRITSFSTAAFLSSGAVVHTLNLRKNSLSSVPDLSSIGSSLLHLDLSFNIKITSFPSSAFAGLSVLQNLTFTDNDALDWDGGLPGLDNLAGSLVSLQLHRSAKLNALGSRLAFLGSYQKLRLLDVSFTGIGSVGDPLPNLCDKPIATTLQKLYIYGNWFYNADVSNLNCYTNLQVLDLYYNEITYVPNFVTGLRAGLKYLNISRHSIISSTESNFNGMTSLETLSMATISLSQFPTFPHVMQITNLDVSDNVISTLSASHFSYLPRLQFLNITVNLLTVIPDIRMLYEGTSTFLQIVAKLNRFNCDCNFGFALLGTDAYLYWKNINVTLSEIPCQTPSQYATMHYSAVPIPQLCGLLTTTGAALTTTPIQETTTTMKTTILPAETTLPEVTTTIMTTLIREETTMPETTSMSTLFPIETTVPELTTTAKSTILPVETSVIEDTTIQKTTTLIPEETSLPLTTTVQMETTSLPSVMTSAQTTVNPDTTPVVSTTSTTQFLTELITQMLPTPKPVVCLPIPNWINVRTNFTNPQLGESITYFCKDGYQFEDLSANNPQDDTIQTTKTSTCRQTDGSWSPTFVGCEETIDKELEAQYWAPVEAENAEFFGLAALLFMIFEVLLLIAMDVPVVYSACRVCIGRLRNRAKPKRQKIDDDWDEPLFEDIA